MIRPPVRNAGLLGDRDRADIAVDAEHYWSRRVLLVLSTDLENRCANDIHGFPLAARPGKSQPAPTEQPEL